MSKDNVVEPFGKKSVAANISDARQQSETNRAATSDAGSQPARNAAAQFDEEILDALRSARKGLTEDGIGAVIALRREIQIATVLEQFLLEGAIDACMEDKDGPLIVSNFRFRRLESEDTRRRGAG